MKNILSKSLSASFVWLSFLAALPIATTGCMKTAVDTSAPSEKYPVFSDSEYEAENEALRAAENNAYKAATSSFKRNDNSQQRAEAIRKYLTLNKKYTDKYPATFKTKSDNGRITYHFDLAYDRYEKDRVYYQGELDRITGETYGPSGLVESTSSNNPPSMPPPSPLAPKNFKSSSEEIKETVRALVKDLKGNGTLSYNYEDARKYVTTRSQSIFAESDSKIAIDRSMKKIEEAFEEVYVDTVAADIYTMARDIHSVNWAKDEPKMLPVLQYYKTRYGVEFSDVIVATGWLGARAPEALALFWNPRSYQQQGIDLTIVTNDLHGKHENYSSVQYITTVQVKGGSLLSQKAREAIFGSQFMIVVDAEKTKNFDENTRSSMLAHELRHCQDFKTNPQIFSPKFSDEEHVRLVKEANAKLNREIERDTKTAAYNALIAKTKAALLAADSSLTPENAEIRAQNFYVEFFNKLWGKYDYFYSQVEWRAFREEAQYLKFVGQSPEQVKATLLSGLGLPKLTDVKGEAITLVANALPLFLTEYLDGLIAYSSR